MLVKQAKIIFLSIFVVFVSGQSCASQTDEPIKFGPKETTDIVFFFKKTATNKEIEYFLYRDGLVIPAENGTGHYLPDGMGSAFAVNEKGFEGFGLNFKPNATDEEKDAIRTRIKNSSIVYRIYEKAIPANIDDL